MDKIKAILIDDEQESIDRLERLLNLTREVNVVATTLYPENTIELIEQNNPDIVFIDVEMPRISGLDIASDIKTKGLKTTVIFVTAHAQYSIKAIKQSAFDYLLKPVDIDDLIKTIERYNSEKAQIITEFHSTNNYNSQNIFTRRELEIVHYLSKGLSSKDISKLLCISDQTVNVHRKRILKKTNMQNITEVVAFAVRKGLV